VLLAATVKENALIIACIVPLTIILLERSRKIVNTMGYVI
jgi:hypothetical protein